MHVSLSLLIICFSEGIKTIAGNADGPIPCEGIWVAVASQSPFQWICSGAGRLLTRMRLTFLLSLYISLYDNQSSLNAPKTIVQLVSGISTNTIFIEGIVCSVYPRSQILKILFFLLFVLKFFKHVEWHESLGLLSSLRRPARWYDQCPRGTGIGISIFQHQVCFQSRGILFYSIWLSKIRLKYWKSVFSHSQSYCLRPRTLKILHHEVHKTFIKLSSYCRTHGRNSRTAKPPVQGNHLYIKEVQLLKYFHWGWWKLIGWN